MKSNRWFLLPMLFILGTFGVASAQWSGGVRGGAYTGTITRPDLLTSITPDFRWSPALSIAVFAEGQLSENVAFRPEVVFQQKGFMMRAGTDLNVGKFPVRLGVKAAYRVNYLETPLLLKLSAGNELAKVYAIVGPSVGYALDAQMVTRPQAILDLRPIRTNVPLDALGYNRFEFSAIGGAGISLKAGAGEIMAEARYQHGVSRLINVPMVQANVRNQGVSLSLGYKIPF